MYRYWLNTFSTKSYKTIAATVSVLKQDFENVCLLFNRRLKKEKPAEWNQRPLSAQLLHYTNPGINVMHVTERKSQ